MSGKELFYNIIERKSDTCGFWHGHPHKDAQEELFKYFGVNNDFELGIHLGDTVCWVMPEENEMYKDPKGRDMFDVLDGKDRKSLNQDGVFAHCENIEDVETFEWPTMEHVDFTKTLEMIDQANEKGMAVLSGCWSAFFHVATDFFGMENYFIKMYTHPEIVLAVTDKIVEFYMEANEKLFDLAGDKIDALFFGNDFGSQLDMLISPDCFNTFVMPYFKKITQQAKKRNYKVVLHSCGAISRVIPNLIEAGVDIIHPIQAKAQGMDANTLQEKFGEEILFMGGVDMQELLTFGTPEQIKEDVKRLKGIFGTNFIISPSHECILPNVSPQNIEALAKAIR